VVSSTIVWEIAAFVMLAAAFEAWERWRPVDCRVRRPYLRLDAFSFACAVLFAWLSRAAIDAGLRALDVSSMVRALGDIRRLPSWQKILLGFVFVDFTIYWVHRAQHSFGLLWRTHAWHHSSPHVNWLSGFRTSLVHSFLYNVPQTVVAMQLLALDTLEAGLAFAIGVFIQLWDHANTQLSIGSLKYVFIRPQDHRVHHAAERNAPANFGFVFSAWDRLFGTYVDPRTMPGNYRVGLPAAPKRGALARLLIGV
jgi:sterol desaturase/sphingolipid hydroxylase (fatty acid hydroxylase superfamily)